MKELDTICEENCSKKYHCPFPKIEECWAYNNFKQHIEESMVKFIIRYLLPAIEADTNWGYYQK